MRNLKELLTTFEKCLQNANAPILKKLRDGLDTETLESILKIEGISHKNLIELYSWKNGIKDSINKIIGKIELFPSAIMLACDESLEDYIICAQQEDIWSKNLFPIFTNGGGNYLLFDIDDKSTTFEMILIYDPMLLLSAQPQTIYDSLENLIQTQIECLVKGTYNFDSEGITDINYDLKYEISAKMNPKSKYWDDYR